MAGIIPTGITSTGAIVPTDLVAWGWDTEVIIGWDDDDMIGGSIAIEESTGSIDPTV